MSSRTCRQKPGSLSARTDCTRASSSEPVRRGPGGLASGWVNDTISEARSWPVWADTASSVSTFASRSIWLHTSTPADQNGRSGSAMSAALTFISPAAAPTRSASTLSSDWRSTVTKPFCWATLSVSSVSRPPARPARLAAGRSAKTSNSSTATETQSAGAVVGGLAAKDLAAGPARVANRSPSTQTKRETVMVSMLGFRFVRISRWPSSPGQPPIRPLPITSSPARPWPTGLRRRRRRSGRRLPGRPWRPGPPPGPPWRRCPCRSR